MLVDSENKTKKISYDTSRHNDLVDSLKNCIQITLNLYRILDVTPKVQNGVRDVVQYCRSLQKLLRKAIAEVNRKMQEIADSHKMQYRCKLLEEDSNRLMKDNKDLKSEIHVLEKQVQEEEIRASILEDERNKLRVSAFELQKQVQKIKKDSEEGLQKIIEVNKNSKSLSERKGSLPAINYHTTREKLGLLLLIDSPGAKIKSNKMLEYIKKR